MLLEAPTATSVIASILRKTNLYVAAFCLAIKEAGHYDARVDGKANCEAG